MTLFDDDITVFWRWNVLDAPVSKDAHGIFWLGWPGHLAEDRAGKA